MQAKIHLTNEKLLQEFPEILEYLKKIDDTLQRLSDFRKKNRQYKKLLQEKKNALLHLLHTVTVRELEILYYLRSLSSIGTYRAFLILRDFYEKECAFKNEVLGEEKYYDFMRCPP